MKQIVMKFADRISELESWYIGASRLHNYNIMDWCISEAKKVSRAIQFLKDGNKQETQKD